MEQHRVRKALRGEAEGSAVSMDRRMPWPPLKPEEDARPAINVVDAVALDEPRHRRRSASWLAWARLYLSFPALGGKPPLDAALDGRSNQHEAIQVASAETCRYRRRMNPPS